MSDTMAFAVGTSSCWYSLTMTVAYLGFVTDSKQLCVASFVIAVSLVRPYLPSSGSTCHRREVQSQCLNLWWRPGKPSMAELISEAFRCFCRYDVCCICLSKDNHAFIPCICRSACGLSIFLCLELSNFGWVAYFPATHVANQETSGSGFLFTASRSSDSMGYIWQAAVSGPCMWTAPTLQSISLHQVRTVRIFVEMSTRIHVLSTFPVVLWDLGDLCGYALRLSPELWNFWELEPLNFLSLAL